jgi:heat-inducible transcriptional repressor
LAISPNRAAVDPEPACFRRQGAIGQAALDEALTQLSGLTRAAAVVLTAKSNSRLKHIEFVRLEPERALAVLVAEDSQVENRVLSLPPRVPSSALTEATNFLNARIREGARWPRRASNETA